MPDKELLAGAAALSITPNLGVSVCGSMQDRRAEHLHDDLTARALVLDNGSTRVALVVLDLIAARKEWLGEIKHQIAGYTKIPLANICISCTHTHSAVSPVDVFQCNADTNYLKWAAPRISDCVRTAVQRGKALSQLNEEELAEQSPLLDREFYAVLSDAAWLESKVSEGGTSLERVREQLDRARSVLAVSK